MPREIFNGFWKRWRLVVSFFLFSSSILPSHFKFQTYSMGTFWRAKIFAEGKSLNGPLVENKLIKIIDSYDFAFSDWRKGSLLAQLEKDFLKWQKGSPLFLKGIGLAKKFYQKSNGKFDITIGAVVWKKLSRPVGLKSLELSPKGFRFSKDPIKLSFGGMAKGMALGALGEYFEKVGLKSYRVDAGGGNIILKGNNWSEYFYYKLNDESSVYFISRSRTHQKNRTHIFDPSNNNQSSSFPKKAVIICKIGTSQDLVEMGATSDALSTIHSLNFKESRLLKDSPCWEFSKDPKKERV